MEERDREEGRSGVQPDYNDYRQAFKNWQKGDFKVKILYMAEELYLLCFHHIFWREQTLEISNTWYKIFEKLLKNGWKNVNLQKVRLRVRSATTLNWSCAHVCVRT